MTKKMTDLGSMAMVENAVIQGYGIQITHRDMNIMSFINEVGYCEIPQIEEQFELNKPRSYQIMKRLVLAGLVFHQRVFHNRPGIYQLTRKGAEQMGLPFITKISVGIYRHKILLAKVYIKLKKKYPEAGWINEQELRRNKFRLGTGKRGHVPDGMLIFLDGRKIAIEVELSLKGRDRLEQIFKEYLKEGSDSIREVWYYCPQELMATLADIAKKLPFIKIFNIQELLR